ncbi:MAG: hypothetical protein AB7N76_08295 [Planctomycetota bacterium]
MSFLRTASPLALCALLVACLPIDRPVKEDDSPKEQKTAAPAEAQSFAGKWKREDTGAEFEVEDDGTTAKGKLVPGTYVWKEGDDKGQEIFAAYTFELGRKGKGLEGKAKFVFKGEEQAYESKWSVTLSGAQLKARIEELSFDDAGKVAERKMVDKTFAFEAAAAPAAAAPAAGGYKLDLATMVQAPPLLPIGEDAAVGMKIVMSTQAGGQTMAHELAIVGEDGDAWRVESNQGLSAYAAMSPDAKDMVMGLTVEKKGGKVTRAVLGKRGEAGKEIKVMAYTPPPQGEAPQGEDTEVETPAGKFSAKLFKTEVQGNTYKSWMGVDGEVEGVLLKTEGPQGGKALKETPSTQSLDLGESVEARKCAYDNGDELWTSTHAVVKALGAGMVKSVAGGATVELKKVATDAKPELKW